MKIKSLKLKDWPPIKNMEIEDIGPTVIIAGANGAGKTRFKQALVAAFQNANAPEMDLEIESTRKEESEKYFGGQSIKVVKGQPSPVLYQYINSRKYGRGQYVGSVVQIDSDRSIQSLKFNPVAWNVIDPDDADTPSNFFFNTFSNRWQGFVDYIYQKTASRDKKIARAANEAEPNATVESITSKHPLPLEKYKKIFADALPGKELVDIDPAAPREFQYRDSAGLILPFSSLSSGEQEVVKVLFDIARKDIRHSVIILDEPELHLHPSLTFKLVESLKKIGDHTNQFFFLTHSPDLISTYLSTGDVYYIDQIGEGENQARRLSDLADSHSELMPLIGQSLGQFAVGKKILFIEGERSSIDRVVYQKLAENSNSEVRVVPCGGINNIMSLNTIAEELRKSIFGVALYMVRDRDGLNSQQIEKLNSSGHLHVLAKRHIENYFLDAKLLFEVAKKLYLNESQPLLCEAFIDDELTRIAKEQREQNLAQNFKDYVATNHALKIPSLSGLQEKNLQETALGLSESLQGNLVELNENLSKPKISSWLNDEAARIEAQLNDGSWKEFFHGKTIFRRLCREVLNADHLHVRRAFVDVALERDPTAFSDVAEFIKRL